MNPLTTPFRKHLLFGAILFCLATSTSYSVTSNSPVGTWEIAVARNGSAVKETGTAYVTFNNNGTFTAYGITTLTFSVFTMTGNWGLNSSGQLFGSYTESLGGNTVNGSFLGRTSAGKKIQVSIVAPNGTFKLNGKPAIGSQDLSGLWVALVTQGGITIPETIDIARSNNFPGVFELTGNATGPSGPFTISGEAILTAKGQVTAYAFSDFQSGGSNTVFLTGKFNPSNQTVNLSGRDLNGVVIRAKLSH